MEKDVVKEFVTNRIEENIGMFSSENIEDLFKKIYLLGLRDGIDLKNQK